MGLPVLIALLVVSLNQSTLQVSSKELTRSGSSAVTTTPDRTTFSIGYSVLSDQFTFREQSVPFKIAVWYPSSQKPSASAYPIGSNKIETELVEDGTCAIGKHPIIFYSHGATGSGTSSFFICELLAKNGYIVVAPDFLDTVYVARIDQPVPFDNYLWMRTDQYISFLRELGLNKASKEGRTLYAYRPAQLKQTMEKVFALNKDSKNFLFDHIDESRIGLFGHSFGAWTSVLLGGASPDLHDKRVKAVAALSGPVNEHVYSVASINDLDSVNVPLLFEYGDQEPAKGRKDDKAFLFDKAKSPKMLISIKDADHLSFSGGVKGEHKTVNEYLNADVPRKTISETTLDFFNAFVNGDESSKDKLKNRTEGVASSNCDF